MSFTFPNVRGVTTALFSYPKVLSENAPLADGSRLGPARRSHISRSEMAAL